jgi:hypothetical protein
MTIEMRLDGLAPVVRLVLEVPDRLDALVEAFGVTLELGADAFPENESALGYSVEKLVDLSGQKVCRLVEQRHFGNSLTAARVMAPARQEYQMWWLHQGANGRMRAHFPHIVNGLATRLLLK